MTDTNGTMPLQGPSAPTANEALAAANAMLRNEQVKQAAITSNAMLVREQWLQKLFDPRRDVNQECGYPRMTQAIQIDAYKQFFDRNAIATRVVECMPKECWAVSPTVYESEDSDSPTEFEEAVDSLGKQIVDGGIGWHKQEKGSTIWQYLQRADILSGIGTFGIMLLGIDDGRNLQDPADGVAMLVGNNRVLEDSPISKKEQEFIAKDLAAGINPDYVPTANTSRCPLSISINAATKPSRNGPVTKGPKLVPISRSVKSNPTTGGGVGGMASMGTEEQYTSAPQMGPSMAGTDQQYFGVQMGPSETLDDQPAELGPKLLFIRVFDESLVQIVRYEWNVQNPRFGQPVMYRVTLNDPADEHSGVGLPMATVYVHWSRVLHIAEDLKSSEVFATPRQRPVWHHLLNVHKLYGAGPEGYWKACFTGFSFETHPQLGGDVDIDRKGIGEQVNAYNNTLSRDFVTSGMAVKTLAPSVVDPSPFIEVQIEAICIQLAIPVRVFKGSERGELASSQDDEKWNDRIASRQNLYLTPKMIVPMFNRLIQLGVLPQPGEDGFRVEWPALDSLGKKDKASIFLSNTQALAAYAGQGNCEAVMPPHNWLTTWGGMDEDEAQQLLDDAAKAQEEAQTMTIPPAGELGNPSTPQPPPQPPMGKPGQPQPGAKPAAAAASGGKPAGGGATNQPAKPPAVS